MFKSVRNTEASQQKRASIIDEDRTLTVAEAEAMLPAGPVIHTLTLLTAGELGGEDWPREQVLRLLRDATAIRPSGDQARATGHGLAVLSPWRSAGRAGPDVMFIETGKRRDQLHYAIGTYAAYLAGMDSEFDVLTAVAAIPPDQMADYTEATNQLRARWLARQEKP